MNVELDLVYDPKLDATQLEFWVDKWDLFTGLLALGFGIALVVVVITASIRLGWRLWPWVFAVGLLAWIFA